MTRFTREIALSGISHQYINPPMSTIIMATVRRMMRAEKILNPVRKNVTTKMVAKLIPTDWSVSPHMVKYCS